MDKRKGYSMKPLVTRESLQLLLQSERGGEVVGRALKAIFTKNQTEEERKYNDTKKFNGIGFSGADARSGSITAKYFIKHGRLEQWQIDQWTRIQKNGFSRLTKYWKQLNEIAMEKHLQNQ
jgi:antitoxin component YwqK of YwqJK toxin-antitoxin module